MEKFSKKTLLNYVNGAGLFGSADASQTVKFAYTENIAKVGTAAEGTITFYADTTNKTGIIAVGGDVVSSKILNVTSTAVNNGKTGENTITVTFFNATTKAADTITFDVVNAAAAKAYFEDYFESSQSIAITGGTADVIVDGATILIDENDGLKSGLKLVYVPASAASGDDPAVDAHIALSDNSNTELYTIPVASIVGNGVLDHSSYDKQKNELHLFFKTAQAGVFNEVVIPVGEILDINDILIANDSSIYLSVTQDTSVVNLGVQLQDVSTADADHNGLASAKAIREYVDSKSTTLAVEAEGDNYVDASVDTNNNKKINVAATDKTKTAVALAETAVQSVVEGASVEGYVALSISAKSDASVITITTDDSSLSAKLVEVDASIDNLQAKDIEIDASIDALQAKDVEIDSSITALKAKDVEIDSSITALKAKDVEIDSSIDRLDTSVSAIETAIAGMDADLSVNTLDGSIGITLSETDGKVTAIGVTATKATVTFDNTGDEPSLTSTSGLLAGDAITPIKNYIDTIAEQGFDGLDSQIVESDTSSYVTVTTGIVDGKLLDASSAVAVQYADLTVAPGAVTVNTHGIATGADVKSAVEGALTWTVLS